MSFWNTSQPVTGFKANLRASEVLWGQPATPIWFCSAGNQLPFSLRTVHSPGVPCGNHITLVPLSNCPPSRGSGPGFPGQGLLPHGRVAAPSFTTFLLLPLEDVLLGVAGIFWPGREPDLWLFISAPSPWLTVTFSLSPCPLPFCLISLFLFLLSFPPFFHSSSPPSSEYLLQAGH